MHLHEILLHINGITGYSNKTFAIGIKEKYVVVGLNKYHLKMSNLFKTANGVNGANQVALSLAGVVLAL